MMESTEIATAEEGQRGSVAEKMKIEKESVEADPANADDGLKCESEDATPKAKDEETATASETSPLRSLGMSDTLKRIRGSLRRPHLRRPRWGSVRGQGHHGKLEEDVPADVANEVSDAAAAAAAAMNAFNEDIESKGDFFQRPMRHRMASQISGFFRRVFTCNDVRASNSDMNLAGTRRSTSDAVGLTYVSNEHAVMPPRGGEGDALDSAEPTDGGDIPEKKSVPPPQPTALTATD